MGAHDILEQVKMLVLFTNSTSDQCDETKMVLVGLQCVMQVHVNFVHLKKLVSRIFLISFELRKSIVLVALCYVMGWFLFPSLTIIMLCMNDLAHSCNLNFTTTFYPICWSFWNVYLQTLKSFNLHIKSA